MLATYYGVLPPMISVVLHFLSILFFLLVCFAAFMKIFLFLAFNFNLFILFLSD